MNIYKFYKTKGEWFVDFPEYLEKGGIKEDLQMVEGADKMLEIISNGGEEVIFSMSKEKFQNADILILKEKSQNSKGGGIYFLGQFENKKINLTLWLCKVTEFAFGEIPIHIFFRKEKFYIPTS